MGKMAPNRSQARPRVTMPRTATANTARNHSNEMMTASMRKATKRLPMMPSNSCGCVTGSKAGDGLLKSMPERGGMVFCSDISRALKGLAFTRRWWLPSDHASEEPPEASSAIADHPSAPAFETAHLEAFGLEFADGLQCMRLVLRLDHEIERGPSRGHVEQRAAVEDLENIRPRSAKNGGDPAKHAGLIGDGESKRNDFSVPLEPAHDNGGEHAGIDIAAAEVEAELAAAKLLGLRQQSGKGGGACTFSEVSRAQMARSMAGSSTSMMRETSAFTIGKVSLPGAFTAIPSASVCSEQTTASPVRAACIDGHAAEETPITARLGLSACRAMALPAIKPPPPTGTTIMSRSGTSSRTSKAMVPWPAMMRGSS